MLLLLIQFEQCGSSIVDPVLAVVLLLLIQFEQCGASIVDPV